MSIIEKVWTTEQGYKAVVVMTKYSHRCGYVGIPREHSLWGLSYMDMLPTGATTIDCTFTVHGGITYSDNDLKYPVDNKDGDIWWFGFDCAHAGDAPEDQSVFFPEILGSSRHGVVRTLDYCIKECEDLAKQLKDYE